MTKLALSVAAMLLASSAAFAGGSDHFDPNIVNQPAAPVDKSYTASIPATGSRTGVDNTGVDTRVVTGSGHTGVKDIIAQHDRDDIWGR